MNKHTFYNSIIQGVIEPDGYYLSPIKLIDSFKGKTYNEWYNNLRHIEYEGVL